jgi:hypothetical protein
MCYNMQGNYVYYYNYGRSRRSAVNIEDWTTGVKFRAGTMMGFFPFATASGPAPGPTQPHTQRASQALTSSLKRPERDADHSPPSSAEIKNA